MLLGALLVLPILAVVMRMTMTAPPRVQRVTTAATSSQDDPEEMARRNAPRVDPDQLLPAVKSGNVTVIDVRDEAAFTQEHIAGARHVALAQVEAMAPYLPKDKPIVAYCT